MINYKSHLISNLLISIALIFQTTIGLCQCDENLLLNGSFTSLLGNSVVAPNWEGISTPDINDASGELNTSSSQYEWIGDIIPSPNEGTWQNIYYPESVFQFVELEVGETYDLCIEYAAQGIAIVPILIFDQPVGVRFIINDTLVYTSPKDETQYTWETDCITFVAKQTMNKIEFQPDEEQYLGIDGACLIKNVTSSTTTIEANNDHFIYPNPVRKNSHLNLHTSNKGAFDLTIYSTNGLLILHESNITTEDFVIPKKLSVAGIYYYTLEHKHHKRLSGTFIVK